MLGNLVFIGIMIIALIFGKGGSSSSKESDSDDTYEVLNYVNNIFNRWK